MKKTVRCILLVSILVLLTGCGKAGIQMPMEAAFPETQTITADSEADPEYRNEAIHSNILVVCFSRTGTTKELAGFAAEYLNTDIFEIEAAVPYTDEDIAYYTNCRADREQNDPSARPEIANRIENIEQYDTILLGYPIWHGQAPRIISTFLESYDFSGITILPFCTSHSSGIGSSDKDLHGLCNAQWKDGKRFAADGDKRAFAEWLSNNIPQNTMKDEGGSMPKGLTLMVDDAVIPVAWEDNAAVAELSKYASDEPIQIAMSMYGGWEQVGSLGHSISRKDVQVTALSGDIMLYSGNQIVLFYGENTWAYTKLGHMDLPKEEVTALLSSGAVAVTLTVS